jgi:hypothetical protein
MGLDITDAIHYLIEPPTSFRILSIRNFNHLYIIFLDSFFLKTLKYHQAPSR